MNVETDELSTDVFPDLVKDGLKTENIWDYFLLTLKRTPNNKFLGRRMLDEPGEPYEWLTFSEVNEYVMAFNQGISEKRKKGVDICK